jgi:triosephosphate isomerase
MTEKTDRRQLEDERQPSRPTPAAARGARRHRPRRACDVAVCVPARTWPRCRCCWPAALALGAQDVSAHDKGAYTGEVSAAMLREFGCRYAIVGHSERRQYHGETDSWWPTRPRPRWRKGHHAHRLRGRDTGAARSRRDRRGGQAPAGRGDPPTGHCVSEMVVAYEPVWAIGTGKTASPEQAQAVHAVLRAQLRAATPAGRACRSCMAAA